jgi:hypothetical protein
MFNDGLTFSFQKFLKLFPCINYDPHHAKWTFISFKFDISGITLSLHWLCSDTSCNAITIYHASVLVTHPHRTVMEFSESFV